MSILRQSTARTVLVGPVLDSAGAAKTDEVVGSIKVTKNGTVGAANGSTTLTHDHAGKYKLAMATGDTDTVGVLEVSLNSGTNDMPVARFNVVEEAVFDAYFAASAAMPVTLAADSITASVFDESTAFPLTSADTGSTAVARTGADSDTLETLSDQLDAKASQASVDDLPTNSELSTALAGADDAVLAAIGDLPTNSDLATALAGADDAVLAAIGDLPTAAEIVTAVKAFEVETGVSFLAALKRMLAESAGKVSVSGATVTFRDVTDSRDQIVATTDSNGQRTAITYNDS